jgi:hypothetical protein
MEIFKWETRRILNKKIQQLMLRMHYKKVLQFLKREKAIQYNRQCAVHFRVHFSKMPEL